MRPPTHHVVQGMPRDESSTRSYGVCHTMPRSRSTARQKPSRSSTDQRYSDAKSPWPYCSAKRRSRLRARYRSVGRQAMSIPLPGSQRSTLRSAASPVSSERVQHAERVLVSARDPGAPPGHVPEILQAGGIAPCAEPQQRRAGVGQLARKGPARLPVETRVVRLIYPVVGPDAPVRREVVARLGPRAPAPDLRLKLGDHAELRSQPLPVVEAAVQRETADGDVLARLDSPVRDVGARDARAVYVLPVEVIRDEAVPARGAEFSRGVEPGLDLRQPRRLAAADDVVRVPGRGRQPRALQGRDLELQLERAGGCQVVKQKDSREPPADHARAKADRKGYVRQRDGDERGGFAEQRRPVLSDAEGGAAVREVHERVTDAKLRR